MSHDSLYDTRWTFDRSWGQIDVRIVNRGPLEYLEFARIAKDGCEPGPVAIKREEMDALVAVVRRCDELMNGNPRQRGGK